MMGIGERWKGLTQKARNFWAELTEDESRKAGSQDHVGGEAVHQRYGGTEKNSELVRGSPGAEQAKRARDEESMDQGPEDAILGNPAARAGRAGQLGSQRGGAQQMQDTQQSRQYTQQGGSGLQKTVGQQMSGQVGSSGSKESPHDEETLQRQPNRSGPGRTSR